MATENDSLSPVLNSEVLFHILKNAESVSVSPVAKYYYTTAIPWLATRRPPLCCVLGWACGEAKTLDSCLEKKAGILFGVRAVEW